MVDGGYRDVELYERVAALEKAFEITLPHIEAKVDKIDEILEDGLQSEVKTIAMNLESHMQSVNADRLTKEKDEKEEKEKKKEWRQIWLYVVRFIMVFLAGVGIGLVYIFADFVVSGRLSKFFQIIDGIVP